MEHRRFASGIQRQAFTARPQPLICSSARIFAWLLVRLILDLHDRRAKAVVNIHVAAFGAGCHITVQASLLCRGTCRKGRTAPSAIASEADMRARLYIVALQTIFALCVSACGGGDVSAPIGATSAKAITPSVTPDPAASDLARAADVVLQPAPPDRTYIKASNTGTEDLFGFATALSADGNTLVVGVRDEDSSATGINGNQLDNSATDAGAVYVYVRNANGVWFQQAYLKASNTGAGDWFGRSVAISADGLTLAVGATGEDSGPLGPIVGQPRPTLVLSTSLPAAAQYLVTGRAFKGIKSRRGRLVWHIRGLELRRHDIGSRCAWRSE